MMSIFEWFDTQKGQLLTAGIAGSAVGAVMEWEGILPGIRRIFVGATTAYFLGPVGVPLFEWAGGLARVPEAQAVSVGGFLVGVGGMVIIEIVIKLFRMRRDSLKRDGET